MERPSSSWSNCLGPFRYKFDYIVLLCPTYVNNKTWSGIGVSDDDFFVDILDPNELSNHLKFWHRQFPNSFVKELNDKPNTANIGRHSLWRRRKKEDLGAGEAGLQRQARQHERLAALPTAYQCL